MKTSKITKRIVLLGSAAGVWMLGGAASAEEHVCRYEERPVVRKFTDATGGSYEQRTYERVRVCEHVPDYTRQPARVTEVAYERDRHDTQRHHKKKHVSYSIGVGYSGGSYGHGYYPSFSLSYSQGYSPYGYPYYPSYRHYSHYGHSYGHRPYQHYSAHHYGHKTYGHHGSHGRGHRGGRH